MCFYFLPCSCSLTFSISFWIFMDNLTNADMTNPNPSIEYTMKYCQQDILDFLPEIKTQVYPGLSYKITTNPRDFAQRIDKTGKSKKYSGPTLI